MIDKKVRRAELEATLAKAETLVETTQRQILVLRGGITMLNELITDEEAENVQTNS